jgi:prophage maintenance system killer protein
MAFQEQNKRVALVALVAFLDLNGLELTADDAAAVEVMLAVAARVPRPKLIDGPRGAVVGHPRKS